MKNNKPSNFNKYKILHIPSGQVFCKLFHSSSAHLPDVSAMFVDDEWATWFASEIDALNTLTKIISKTQIIITPDYRIYHKQEVIDISVNEFTIV
jgi:hypothetical protein